MGDLLIVLTARCGSERFPNKVIQDVDGRPLVSWIIKRLQKTKNSTVVLGTTQLKEDDTLEAIAKSMRVPCYRHPDPEDVVGRLTAVLDMFPNTTHILRALGDCPFMAPEILEEAVKSMETFKAEAFSWMIPAETLPVYGAREFPYAISAWRKIDKNSKGEERQHCDAWFNHNRSFFKIVFHEPPTSEYFRTYRLEVDWPQDLELVRRVAKGVGMLAPLPDITRWLDNNPEVVLLNSQIREKTGPTITFNYHLRRAWFKMMEGKSVVDWQGHVWKSPHEKATPVFCNNGRCLIGYGFDGSLYTKEGHCVRGYARITCDCGSGKIWRAPIHSARY